MTREEAIALRPQSAVAYGWQLGMMSFVAACFFAFLALGSPAHHNWNDANFWIVCVSFLLIILVPAAQAAERLFFPIRAAERSARFSEAAKERSRQVGKVCSVVGISVAMIGSFGALTTSIKGHHVLSDMRIVGWAIYFVSFLLADLRGESMSKTFRQRANVAAGLAIDWKQWNPIRSEHWGNR